MHLIRILKDKFLVGNIRCYFKYIQMKLKKWHN